MNDVKNRLEERIIGWKKALLDMSKRNRLLWYKPYRVGTLKLEEDTFDTSQAPLNIIKNLISENTEIQFEAELPVVPPEPREGETDYEKRKQEWDTAKKSFEKIKSRNKALEIIRRNIKTENDEKGLNIGYIAVGFLEWYEREDASDAITSPLIMVPVTVEQDSRKAPFRVKLNADEDIAINPVVNKKFESDFNISLDSDGYNFANLEEVLDKIQDAIKEQSSWSISHDAVLDTFNFQNLVIWSDLDKNAELIFGSQFGQILGGELPIDVGLTYDDTEIDLKKLKSRDNLTILESDSSQLEAIYRARNGESFVIQGPPGTGKSQTISNIIAEQLFLGKKVLFVSEKQAALDVVYHKLEQKGLSDFCLIMHNAKQRKSDVREQLQKSLDLTQDKKRISDEALQALETLDQKSESLNLYAEQLHVRYDNGLTPYFVIGELAKLHDVPDVPFNMPDGFRLNADYDDVIRKVFDFVESYAISFIDDTHHFDVNQWESYTGEFSNTTRRLVEEAIGSADMGAAKRITSDVKVEGTEEAIDTILNKVGEFNEIFDRIPFRQADTSEIKSGIEKIQQLQKKVSDTKEKIAENEAASKQIDDDSEQKIRQEDTKLKELRKEIKEFYADSFFDLENPNDIHKALSNKYGSMFSRLSGDYRTFIKQLDVLTTSKMKYGQHIAYLDKLIDLNSGAKRKEKIVGAAEESKSKLAQDSLRLNKQIQTSQEKIQETLSHIGFVMSNVLANTEKLLSELDFNKLQEYQNYVSNRNHLLSSFKLDNFVEKIEDNQKSFRASEIVDIFKKRYFTIFLENTVFGEKYYDYTRDNHDRDINAFREYDAKALKISALRVRSKLLYELPNMSGFSNSRQSGEIGILRRELKKKSRLMSTRKLIEYLPVTIPQIKPCMMMSPLTVSSYFGTNTDWKFDLVIFDEASQVKPEYAISAIVRGKQIIVAGDSKQMPPTRFFDSSSYYEGDYDEIDADDMSDLESILDEMSTLLPDMYLNWHYRSKDESLITFSNRQFYNNRLFTFPSTYSANDGVGVGYIYCEDGVWESKNGNKNEAEMVAKIIFDHIQKQPNRSLGVIAFGKSHENAIFEAVNKMRDMHPELEDFFSEAKDEHFFIKNLENVQGDERDRIILSCGYGKDANGTFAMRFGPLAMAGGERRLNVAVSRAKYQMTVVSSFKANEIRGTDENANRKLLRDFIDYSERGLPALIGDDAPTSDELYQPEFDSTFEEEVYNFITQNGYSLRTQVGSSGYRIDMAVLHPEIEGRFVLAIECDGAAYHSSRTARDRDILRQEILQNLGWKFYRIWSTNWINNNHDEKERLLEVIEGAIRGYFDEPLALSGNEDEPDNDSVNLVDIPDRNNQEILYKHYRNKLVTEYGGGYFNNETGHYDTAWNSLYIMKHSGVLEAVLKEAVKNRSGYSPEDLFREINEKVFDKSRYTTQAEAVYKKAFQKLIANKNVEIAGNTIRYLK